MSGFAPVNADTVLCWGESHREQLATFGVPRERLVLVGCPRLTPCLPVNRDAALAKVGLAPDKPVVLLATNTVRDDLKRRLARSFCEVLTASEMMVGVVRLHPSEKLEEYSPVIRAFPAVRFLANAAWSLDEALASADVVVSHDSGIGNDALVKGRPLVVYDFLPQPLMNGAELVAKAGCPVARNGAELRGILEELVHDPSARALLVRRADGYVRSFCAAYGEEAARNVAREVMSRLGPPL